MSWSQVRVLQGPPFSNVSECFVKKDEKEKRRKMSAICNVAEFKGLLSVVNSLKQMGVNIPLFVHGRHGIGKSEIPEEFALANGMRYVPLFLSLMDTTDLLGMPFRDATGATRFATPDWLRDLLQDPRPALVHIDELNRATPYVLQSMFQFILSGRLHTHALRPQDYVLAAANPDTAEYSVNSFEDAALMSRFAHIYFEPEIMEWAIFAKDSGVHASVLDVVKANPALISNTAVDEGSRIKASPDRRNLVKIGKALALLPANTVEEQGYRLISALVGSDLAAPLMTAYREHAVPTLEDILQGKVLGRLDVQRDLDKIAGLSDALILAMCSKDFVLWEDPALTNVRAYINAIPLDAQFAFLKSFTTSWTGQGKDIDSLNDLWGKLDEDFVEKIYTIREEIEAQAEREEEAKAAAEEAAKNGQAPASPEDTEEDEEEVKAEVKPKKARAKK
jgi:hypothetical protein